MPKRLSAKAKTIPDSTIVKVAVLLGTRDTTRVRFDDRQFGKAIRGQNLACFWNSQAGNEFNGARSQTAVRCTGLNLNRPAKRRPVVPVRPRPGDGGNPFDTSLMLVQFDMKPDGPSGVCDPLDGRPALWLVN